MNLLAVSATERVGMELELAIAGSPQKGSIFRQGANGAMRNDQGAKSGETSYAESIYGIGGRGTRSLP